VDEALMAAVLTHPDGGRKGVPPGARWVPLINKADTPQRLARAERLAGLLLEHTERVVVARVRAEPPVVRILERGS
jgi:molybdenum cofactor cytidylyltransferase